MNLKELTGDELNQLRVQILTEIERRENLAAIPSQIAGLVNTYLNGGGDRADLDDALEGGGEHE